MQPVRKYVCRKCGSAFAVTWFERVKFDIIDLIDTIEAHVIGHRWHWLCKFISFHSWWGACVCDKILK